MHHLLHIRFVCCVFLVRTFEIYFIFSQYKHLSINSPLGTASVASHKFWYVVLPLFFVQRYFFSFSASLTHSSEACCSTYTYLWTSHVFSCYWFPVSDHCGPLNCKDIKPVSPKGNLPWIFTGRTNVEAEALKLWLTDVKSWLTGTDPDAGKDWRQKEKGATEDEMAR